MNNTRDIFNVLAIVVLGYFVATDDVSHNLRLAGWILLIMVVAVTLMGRYKRTRKVAPGAGGLAPLLLFGAIGAVVFFLLDAYAPLNAGHAAAAAIVAGIVGESIVSGLLGVFRKRDA